MIRPHSVRLLVRHDLYCALRSTRGLLFLVFFGAIWLWLLWKLGQGSARWMANPEGSWLIAWLFDAEIARALFSQRAPTLSAFYLLAMSTLPMFVLFAASDQTANDIGNKYLRFLMPRCLRSELYLARLLGACVLVAGAYALIGLIALGVTLMVDDPSAAAVLPDGLLVIASLVIYALPFVALMSLCSAVVGSAALSALIGFSVYVTLGVIIAVVGIRADSAAQVLSWLLPSASKGWFLKLHWGSLPVATLLSLAYTTVYAWLGWLVFSRRDI